MGRGELRFDILVTYAVEYVSGPLREAAKADLGDGLNDDRSASLLPGHFAHDWRARMRSLIPTRVLPGLLIAAILRRDHTTDRSATKGQGQRPTGHAPTYENTMIIERRRATKAH